ncbi:hypothetical protein GUITHDRAFT_122047 [Guillardia theta CCMP2712]|uniref:Uncharacterized protein n=1 Tax=Guillardia theta (strain CCMP2712) TaxID=905079 RepID=L1I7B6_GUITC|nr:hypothetical protein GUITHDRAFT_122047 [Guillardia theta CCMP2712]EKX31759.1 hypothetical protein GUITHDRAFT_122047 [Guillardia theta CCMP2712]|eukprot:XP_005818739.1 hypothetical protein GUITHDRAFT_122047 [Guillardia theta CCMP2712]
MGFCELRTEVDNDSEFSKRRQVELARFLLRLGYDTVAFNVSATGLLKPHHRCQISICDMKDILSPQDASNPPLRVDSRPVMQQLLRMTVTVDDISHLHMVDVSNEIASGYHLLAVCPLTDKVFEQCCKFSKVDIISLDLANRLAFPIKAIDRGVFFEITYGPCLRDAGARRQLFSNAMELVRATRGRNLIISSQAERAMELRSPHDVISMSEMLGLGQGGRGKLCLDANASKLLAQARKRRRKSGHATVTSTSKVDPRERWSIPGGGEEERARGGGEKQDFISLALESDESDSDKVEGNEEELEAANVPEQTAESTVEEKGEGTDKGRTEEKSSSLSQEKMEISPAVKASDRKRPLEQSTGGGPKKDKKKRR